jgi:hypothetical protein
LPLAKIPTSTAVFGEWKCFLGNGLDWIFPQLESACKYTNTNTHAHDAHKHCKDARFEQNEQLALCHQEVQKTRQHPAPNNNAETAEEFIPLY